MMLLGFFPLFPLISPLLFIYGLGCLLFSTPLYVLNQNGSEEKDNWLDLKKIFIRFFLHWKQNDRNDKIMELLFNIFYFIKYRFFSFKWNKKEINNNADLITYKKILEYQKNEFMKYKDIIENDIKEELYKYSIR